MTCSPINTSFEAIKHQLTIARFGDSLDKKGIGITTDPFGAGAYTVRVEIFEVYKFSWISWYTPYPRKLIHNKWLNTWQIRPSSDHKN